MEQYIRRVEMDISEVHSWALASEAQLDRVADSLYFGGGTPSVLDTDHLKRLFTAVRTNFDLTDSAEITVECAPGTLSGKLIDALVSCGVNRVSLGVQSFVDKESRAVGRLHTREVTLEDVARLRNAGISEITIDLIAGLPYQTRESWTYSLEQLIETDVPHASVYMLEVDEDSRLGRELMAGGTRYHAHHVPNDDLTADLYMQACDTLANAGICQYEISNFAREGHQSSHNLKYWTRQPYVGFGVDAHSMLTSPRPGEPHHAIRFASVDDLERYNGGAATSFTDVNEQQAIEEAWFLGLRLNRGIDLLAMKEEYGANSLERYQGVNTDLVHNGLLELDGQYLRLTPRGILLSNEVFASFLPEPAG